MPDYRNADTKPVPMGGNQFTPVDQLFSGAPTRDQFVADPANKPARCVYIVRFWMANVGYGRREWEADNAWQAGFQVEGHIRSNVKDADVVIIGVVRK